MKYSFTKNPESEFFIKNPNLTKKKKILAGERGGGGGVARVSDFFCQKNPSLKKNCFLFEGVKVREYWLV